MGIENTSDKIKTLNILSFYRKTFSVFLVFFFQCLSAQVSVGEGAELYVSSETIIHDASTQSENRDSKAKIYVFGETKIFHQNSESNFKIVTLETSKEQIVSQVAIGKNKKVLAKNTEIAKPKLTQKKLENTPTFTSCPESHIAFSQYYNRNIAVVNVQKITAKAFLSSHQIEIQSFLFDLSREKISLSYDSELSTLSPNYFSVRPPPFLI